MSEEQKIRVVIADDQELVRAGFAMVIGSQPDMAVVGQARDGAEAVALAETLHPDVVLMDVRMPGVDGIEATRRISALQHRFAPDGSALDDAHTRVIILTTFDLDEYVMAAINAGASGFLLKEFPRIVEEMADYPAVRVRGLMTVPPIGRKKGDNCRCFQKIRRIAVDITAQKYDNIFMDFLSMGMTDDFEDAIACGSTMVRIGTAIFGPRNYAPVKSD